MSSPLGDEEFALVMEVDSLPLEPTEVESPAPTVLDTPASSHKEHTAFPASGVVDPSTLDTLPANLEDFVVPPPPPAPKDKSLDELDKRILELQHLECRVCVCGQVCLCMGMGEYVCVCLCGVWVCWYLCSWMGGWVGV